MIVDVVEESQPDLAGYASIPIALDVRDVARIVAGPPPSGGFTIDPHPLAVPRTKNLRTPSLRAAGGEPRCVPGAAGGDAAVVVQAAVTVIPSGGP